MTNKKANAVVYILIMLISAIIFCMINTPSQVYADTNSDAENELRNDVQNGLSDIDFSDIDNLIKSSDFSDTFGESFREKIEKIVNGEYFSDYDNIFLSILDLVFDGVSDIVPLILSIVGLTVLGSIISLMKSGQASVSEIVNFAIVTGVVVLLSVVFKEVISLTWSTINLLNNQIEIIMPIILTMLVAVGGYISVGIYKPVVAFLSGGIAVIFKSVLMPITILSFVFVVLNNLSSNVKLNKFIDFFGSLFKYITGFVFTIFAGFLTVQGISAGKHDGISFKTAKYAIKSYVPIVGSYLSDGLDLVVLSSAIIKNAIGVGGLILLFCTILIPLIKIIVIKLALGLSSSIIEPIGNGQVSNLCSAMSKVMIYPIVMILCVSFMYLLMISLTMCTVSVI